MVPGQGTRCSNPPSPKWSSQISPLRLTESFLEQNFSLHSHSRIFRVQNQSNKLPSGVRASAVGNGATGRDSLLLAPPGSPREPEAPVLSAKWGAQETFAVLGGLPSQDTVVYRAMVVVVIEWLEKWGQLLGVRSGEAQLWFRSVSMKLTCPFEQDFCLLVRSGWGQVALSAAVLHSEPECVSLGTYFY